MLLSLKQDKTKMDYTILKKQEEREQLKEAAYNISKFIKKHNTPTIIALDKSGRPAGLLISYAYKTLYPDEKQPKVFFLNPGEWHYKTKPKTVPLETLNLSLSKYISEHPNEPVIILDEFLASGRTIKRVKNILKNSAVGRIYSAVISRNNYTSKKEVDIVGSKNPELGSSFEDKRWEGLSGIKENGGRSFPNPKKGALELRQELKYLASEITPKPRGLLSKIFGFTFILFGLIALIIQNTVSTGAVISTSQSGNASFIMEFVLIIIGGFLVFQSFKDNIHS